MKKETDIRTFNHEDLVDLLSTAFYGSTLLACDYSKETYKKAYYEDDECIEDIMAKLLLSGDKVFVGDMYAQDASDCNGSKLPHKYDAEQEIMWYDVTLEDIRRGVQSCMDCVDANGNNDTFLHQCAVDFLNGKGDMDLIEAESIMQVILFGKLIYG